MSFSTKSILLIFPRLYSSEMMHSSKIMDHPPLGLLTIAAPLVKIGYNVTILDEQVENNFYPRLDSILKKDIFCVGISSMSGSHIKSALRISNYIKQTKNVPIVVGGVHVTLLPEITLESPFIDIVVIGDGEETFVRLLDALQSKKDLNTVRGIGYKSNGQLRFTAPSEPADITKIPRLPFELMNLSGYHPGLLHFWPSDNRTIAMETSRGCPYSCTFCTESVRKKKWRALPEEQVIADIKYYQEKYKVDNFLFIDDNFFGNKKRGTKLIDLLIEANLGIRWYTNVRADFLDAMDASFYKRLEISGCRMLTFGAESGSQKILNRIEKRSKVNTIYEINRKLKKTRIIPHFVAIRGFPSEKKQDLIQTMTQAIRILLSNKKSCFDIPHLIPTPGTIIADECFGDKKELLTLDKWQEIFNLELMREKPEWILDETYHFMKANRRFFLFISQINRPYYPLLQRINFRFRIRIIHFCIKAGLIHFINLKFLIPNIQQGKMAGKKENIYVKKGTGAPAAAVTAIEGAAVDCRPSV